ncbi:hypothetical protein F5887DRAFT_637709 [Amanita rubescens]|nr:hypothetical protein F5887DRAFT_637709 [Amanita rubescens]
MSPHIRRFFTLSLNTQCSERRTRRRTYLLTRLASTAATSDNPYPYPAHRNPTPHQIFHLPANASEENIKTRYYDLVRIYHPDKAGLSVSPDIAHSRFQAIAAAYDILRRKTAAVDDATSGPSVWAREGGYPTAAAWRAASQAKRAQELYSGGKIDDRWKDRLFLGGVALTVGVFVFQVNLTRKEAMVDVIGRSRHAAGIVHDHSKNTNDNPDDAKRLSA